MLRGEAVEGLNVSTAGSQAGYAAVLPEASAKRRGNSTLIPLLVFTVALAAVTLWFLGRPVLTAPSTQARACETVVLQSGTVTCVTGTDHVIRVG